MWFYDQNGWIDTQGVEMYSHYRYSPVSAYLFILSASYNNSPLEVWPGWWNRANDPGQCIYLSTWTILEYLINRSDRCGSSRTSSMRSSSPKTPCSNCYCTNSSPLLSVNTTQSPINCIRWFEWFFQMHPVWILIKTAAGWQTANLLSPAEAIPSWSFSSSPLIHLIHFNADSLSHHQLSACWRLHIYIDNSLLLPLFAFRPRFHDLSYTIASGTVPSL